MMNFDFEKMLWYCLWYFNYGIINYFMRNNAINQNKKIVSLNP